MKEETCEIYSCGASCFGHFMAIITVMMLAESHNQQDYTIINGKLLIVNCLPNVKM